MKNIQTKSNDFSLFDLINDGIIAAEFSTKKIIYVNNSAVNLFGYSKKEFESKSINDIHPQKVIKTVLKEFTEIHDRKGKLSRNIACLRKNRSIFYCDINSTRMKIGDKTCLLGVFRDISVRKNLEDLLLISDERFRELFNNMFNGMIIYKPIEKGKNFLIYDINEAGLKFENRKKEELLGKTVTDVNLAFINSLLLPILQRVYNSGLPEFMPEIEYNNGSSKLFRENYLFKLSTGEIVSMYKDITHRKIYERNLKIKTDLINYSLNATCITNLKFILLEINDSFLRLWGYKNKKDLQNKTINELLINNLKHDELINELSKNGRALKEVKGIKKNGKLFDLIVFSSLVKDELKNPVCYTFSFVDITEFKENQKELAIFKRFVEASGQGFRISSLDGFIIYANSNLCNLLGIKNLNELYGKSIFEFFTDPVVDNYKNTIMSILKTGNSWTGEILLKSIENKIIPILDNFFFIQNIDGKPEYLAEVITDISEIKNLQDQLIYSEKLSAIGQLASGIAHEFNNILAVIKSTSQMLLFYLEKGKITLPPEIADELAVIDKQTDNGAKIVSNIMALVKSKNYTPDLYFISEIIDEVIELQHKEMELENIKVVKNISIDYKIKIDKVLIQQILLNLFINSRHAIKPKGRGEIKISVHEEYGSVIINFEDTGIGMEDEIKRNIFNPFFTTKGAFSTNNLGLKGIGLGLSIVLKIIKDINGEVNVESLPKKGTKFIIKIPLIK
ncbi:MAG: PAS domain S-box protein [Spirochaetes bacterium]|nr:PAS domain S-box protein [Spirochaetota bacterium]